MSSQLHQVVGDSSSGVAGNAGLVEIIAEYRDDSQLFDRSRSATICVGAFQRILGFHARRTGVPIDQGIVEEAFAWA